MGIPTLIKTQTASDSASLSFIHGASDVVLDSTYDEYMFVFTDINPATSDGNFQFQVNATGGADYNDSAITSTSFRAQHKEDDTQAELDYITGSDQANVASFQPFLIYIANGSDDSAAGEFHLFNPASTTYVKHFYSISSAVGHVSTQRSYNAYIAGYINDTAAIGDIKFMMSSGNFDGVIQMYGIS